MKPNRWAALPRWLFTWEGTVTRRQYFAAGALLLVLKYGIDSAVASRFGIPWKPWVYFVPHSAEWLRRPEMFYLWAIAVPFFLAGMALTVRRLRSAAIPVTASVLFFAPGLNLALFLALCLIPERDVTLRERESADSNGAVAAMMIAAILALAAVIFGGTFLAQYGWGLFLGAPFLAGFSSAWIFNARQMNTWPATLWVASGTIFLAGLLIFALAYEGLVCLVMALPLALPFAWAGARLAYALQRATRRPSAPTLAAGMLILPLLMLGEHALGPQPPLQSVTTSVVIQASPEAVWRNVLAFAPLPPPRGVLFHTGIAYPTSAQIDGSGVGAVRYCRFSTGNFVEPITAWRPNHLLAFNVASQPPSLHELSPWEIHPPHLDRDYMRSRRGQFLLVALPGGSTRLEGTTWYQNYFWPQPYWRLWSDFIVHHIHLRVLEQVKRQAELESRASAAGLPGVGRK